MKLLVTGGAGFIGSEFVRQGVERFINISTDEVYGELGSNGQFFETTPLNPNSPYSVSKASSDMLGRAYYRTYGLPVVTVRPSNNYGPWQYPEKLIPLTILKAHDNERIPVYGKGENVREWLFVSDCAEALFTILEKDTPGEVYNVGSGEEERNIEVVKDILQILGKPEGLIEFVKDRPGHDFRYSLNSERIRKQLGWQSKVHNISGWFTEKASGINQRVFDVPACGGFLLTDYMDELESFFKIGEEIEAYKSVEELIDKIQFYLKHEDIKERIAIKGYEKAQRLPRWKDWAKEVIHSFQPLP